MQPSTPLTFFLKRLVLTAFTLTLSGPFTAFAQGEESPTKESLAIGAKTGELIERALRADGFAPPPVETPAPQPTVAPTPGPVQGACPEGQFQIAPGICIGKRNPTIPNHPKDLEFKLCFKFDGVTICQPGYFDCKTDKHGVTTCKLRIFMPPLIPDVKCDFTPAPDGGTQFTCSFPDPRSPTDKKTVPGKITFPGDGTFCIQAEDSKPMCFPLDDLKPYPFIPELMPLLPGYPATPKETIEPAKQSGGEMQSW